MLDIDFSSFYISIEATKCVSDRRMPFHTTRGVLVMKTPTIAIIIGKISPFHNGHATLFERALHRYDYVLGIVGSANQPRTPKLPWTAEERVTMIKRWASERFGRPNESYRRLDVVAIRDFWYQDQLWATAVQTAVRNFKKDLELEKAEVYIVGANKDWSTYYLKLFPAYKKDLVKDGDVTTFQVNATAIRDLYFSQPEAKFYAGELPPSVITCLEEFKGTEHYKNVLAEFEFFQTYKSRWKDTKYPVIFQTVDAVVIQGAHVLMVKRRSAPGKGLYALPGGFVGENERLQDAVIRELREETKLKVPVPVLLGCMKGKEDFDDPGRSLRGRTITKGFLFHLNEADELPMVKGSSDAAKAFWVPLSDLEELEPRIFEDHLGIIQKMTGAL
jgi:bifunctional NMN adenylyltransferase/nudix hydrolase